VRDCQWTIRKLPQVAVYKGDKPALLLGGIERQLFGNSVISVDFSFGSIAADGHDQRTGHQLS
jgi:hypothetical protein